MPARALVALVAVVAGLAPRASSATTSGVTVAITPVGSTSVHQGASFRFTATAQNPDPTPATVTVLFELAAPAGREAPVDFRKWTVTVPSLGSASTAAAATSAQWFAELGTFTVTPLIDGVGAGSPLSYDVTAATVVVPQFVDVTASAGLSTTLPKAVCGDWGAGAAWGDVNGDGALDLYVPSRTGPSQLWINDGTGHFTDQAAARGVDNVGFAGAGATFADYNNDGAEDLYVVNDGTPNRLFRNDGTGHFTDVTGVAGVGDAGVGPSAAWGDYNGDGFLDLYVVNHGTCGYVGQQDRLYRNNGAGTFTDVTDLLPAAATDGLGFQAAWFDVNGDGRQDLYLANDDVANSHDVNHLWRNDGPGPGGTWLLTDVSASSGADFAINSMGIGIGDFNRDGRLDLAISNKGPTVLARNNGDGTFTNVAEAKAVARPMQSATQQSITWGLGFADFNLDGWEDLYVAAGAITSLVPQPNELFVNPGTGPFLDLSAPSGAMDAGGISRGVAFADYNGDGLVDLYVVDLGGSPHLYENVTPVPGLHWLEVRTTGTMSNRDGCGARLTVVAGGATMVREVLCGSTSLASGSDRTAHFGLGTASTVTSLTIDWPSGVRQVLTGLGADQLLQVTEP